MILKSKSLICFLADSVFVGNLSEFRNRTGISILSNSSASLKLNKPIKEASAISFGSEAISSDIDLTRLLSALFPNIELIYFLVASEKSSSNRL